MFFFLIKETKNSLKIIQQQQQKWILIIWEKEKKKQSKLTGKKSGIKVFNNNIEFSFSVVLVFKQKKI